MEEDWEFIYGIKSWDDLTSSEANLYTMNDFDVTFNKKEKKYYMGIKTIYQFSNGKQGEKNYIKQIFIKFTKWMISQNYDVDRQSNIWEMFTEGKNINSGFDSIEELYATFECLVNGFINT